MRDYAFNDFKGPARARGCGAGFSLLQLLGLLFIGLKLGGAIAWSWWWVLAPFWVPLAVLCLVGIAALIVLALAAWAESR